MAFPAQAIKGVVVPDSQSEEDKASNFYREIEAFNLQFTMRAEPLGVGFGKPFYRPAPMPDISSSSSGSTSRTTRCSGCG